MFPKFQTVKLWNGCTSFWMFCEKCGNRWWCLLICPIHETLAAYVLTKYLVCSWVYQIHSNVIFIWIEIDDLNVCLWSFEKYSLRLIFWMGYSCSIYPWCLMGTQECWNPWKTWIPGPPFHYSRYSSTTSDTREIPVWNSSKPPEPTCSDLSHQPH